ncbi:hypothetical protein UO65_1911 [Actinokineospora spheciospongiae]|uniref:Uncharacterized protein n=1 Tax=Actinokineospora spheciospongiae TaxID=909613 RepID=W7J9T5_9PSEU|nr:hypothetical protein UO65_1911 [Actinokineospora spheciospongiae]
MDHPTFLLPQRVSWARVSHDRVYGRQQGAHGVLFAVSTVTSVQLG